MKPFVIAAVVLIAGVFAVNGETVKCIDGQDSKAATEAAPTTTKDCSTGYCMLTVVDVAGVRSRTYDCGLAVENCILGVCTWKGANSNDKKDCDCDTYVSTADAEAEAENENADSGAVTITAAVSSVAALIAYKIFA